MLFVFWKSSAHNNLGNFRKRLSVPSLSLRLRRRLRLRVVDVQLPSAIISAQRFKQKQLRLELRQQIFWFNANYIHTKSRWQDIKRAPGAMMSPTLRSSDGPGLITSNVAVGVDWCGCRVREILTSTATVFGNGDCAQSSFMRLKSSLTWNKNNSLNKLI